MSLFNNTSAIGAGLINGMGNTTTGKPTSKPGIGSFADAMTAAEKFMKYQEMTAAEKFRASYLAEKGLTEDDLKAMSAEDRAKIEAEIAAKIREKMAQGVEKKLAGVA